MNVSLAGGTPEGELPAGYKRAEIGVIPESWDVVSLGDIAEIKNGATPSTRVSANWNGSIPWCTPTDITNSPGKYLTGTTRSVTQQGLVSCGTSLLPVGALLLCSRATIGEIKIAAIFVCTNQGFKSLVCTEQVHNEFLYYLILSLKPRLIRQAIGSTFMEVGKRSLASMQIQVPPLREQRAIAEALSDVDGLIESLETLIAKKRTVKTATMQELLTGKTRLPGFSREWEMRRLGDVASFFKGSGLSKSDLFPGGKRRCILYGELFTIYGERITEILHGTNREGAFFVSISNDVLMPTSDVTPNGLATASCIPFSDVILGSDILVIRIPEYLVSGEFLAYTIKMHHNQVMQLVSGTTVFHLYSRDMANFKFSIPNIKEQRAIATILSDMDTEIAALEQRRDKARALKQGMMQQLLTGKIRLIESAETTARRASATSTERKHNWQFNEAVVIAVLTKNFGDKKYPLSRMRYTKLSYLLHRHAEGCAEGYLKKAAGPYNPSTRYGGPEKIALTNDYVCIHKNDRYSGFIAGENVKQAEIYFVKWYGEDCLKWLDQFRYEKRDELELLTTVDFAVEELREAGKIVSVECVKKVIHSDTEWKAKLNRAIFSNTNIARAIENCRRLFGVGNERPKA